MNEVDQLEELARKLNLLRFEFDLATSHLHGLEDDDDGGSNVREPRRPLPAAPSAAMALELVA